MKEKINCCPSSFPRSLAKTTPPSGNLPFLIRIFVHGVFFFVGNLPNVNIFISCIVRTWMYTRHANEKLRIVRKVFRTSLSTQCIRINIVNVTQTRVLNFRMVAKNACDISIAHASHWVGSNGALAQLISPTSGHQITNPEGVWRIVETRIFFFSDQIATGAIDAWFMSEPAVHDRHGGKRLVFQHLTDDPSQQRRIQVNIFIRFEQELNLRTVVFTPAEGRQFFVGDNRIVFR